MPPLFQGAKVMRALKIGDIVRIKSAEEMKGEDFWGIPEKLYDCYAKQGNFCFLPENRYSGNEYFLFYEGLVFPPWAYVFEDSIKVSPWWMLEVPTPIETGEEEVEEKLEEEEKPEEEEDYFVHTQPGMYKAYNGPRIGWAR